MGTAVLHPQDCLPPSQSQPNRRLPLATARSASVLSNRAMDSCVRHGSAENHGILGHRASSGPGLLPLPEHVPQIAYSPSSKSAAKFSPHSYKRCRSPTSGYGFAIPLQRDSSSSRDLLSHGRRKSACNDLGNAAPAGVPKVVGTGGLAAHLPTAPLAKAHFPRLYSDTDLLKWSKQYKLSEVSQPVSERSTSVTKQIFNDAANVRTPSRWKCSKASPMKHRGDNRKLNCSPSGKTQQEEEICTAVSCNEQVAGTLVRCLSNMSALTCRQNGRSNGSPGFSSAFNKENKTETCPLQGSLCGKSNEKYLNFGSSALTGRSSSPWAPQFVDATERTREVMNQESLFKIMEMRNAERSHQCSPSGLIGKDGAIEGRGSIFPQVAVCNTANFNWHFRAKDVLSCLDSAYDASSWLSMVDEGWAGPSFSNSPPPSSLPVPRFTSKLSSRSAPTSPSPMNDEASPMSGAPSPEIERTWDIARATKDLRRLLRLDHAYCDA